MRVNLIADNKKKISVNWARVGITSVFMILIAFILFNYLMLRSDRNALQMEVDSLEQQIAMYEPKVKEFQNLKEQVQNLDNTTIRITNYHWAESLFQLGYIIPPKTMLTDLQIDREKITFKGIAESTEQVITFSKNLEASPVFTDIKLNQVEKKDDAVFTINANIFQGE